MTTITNRNPAPETEPPPAVPRRSVAGWCADHRWRTLLAAALVLAGCVMLLSGGMRAGDGNDELVGDSRDAAKIADAVAWGDPATERIVVRPRSGTFTPEQARQVGEELGAAYTALPQVTRLQEPMLAPDGGTLVLPVELRADPRDDDAVEAAATPVIAATDRLVTSHPELSIGQVGDGSVGIQVSDQLDKDFTRAELFSLPVTLAVLLIAFGAVVAAGVPLLIGVGSVAAAMGITAYISRHGHPVDDATQSLLLLIGLAVGVDYALFVLRRSREERANGASPREAVKIAGRTAGRAVIISGMTVVVAMSGMLVAGGLFTGVAIGTTVVVAVSVLASATVLPALLSVLGDKVEALRLPWIGRRRAHASPENGAWGRLAGRVTRRPVLWTAAAAGVLLALAVPALGMHTSLPGDESLSRDLAAVRAYDQLKAAFPQEGTTIDVVVKAPAGERRTVERALTAAFPAAVGTGEIAGREPDLRTSTDGTVTIMSLASPRDTSDPETEKAVDAVRADVIPVVERGLEGVPGARVHTGGAAMSTDLSEWMSTRMPRVLPFVLVLTFAVMLLSFGSTWLAAATVGLNLLSVGAAYGVLTLVFQNEWAEDLLGFASVGSVVAWLPLLMFVILFGLSMDYHVFVVSRVREAWSGGASPAAAVRTGVARSAGVVTSAAAVMVAVFAIFGTLSQLELKQMGVGLATAVLLDATVVRGVLLPGVLTLLGDRAHTGPRWLPRIHH